MRVERLGEGEPELAVVGGIHGDEPCGSRGVEHFLKERPDLERPVAFIIANEEATAASRRYIDADLNRSFPGDPDGDAHESRLAHAVGETVGDCVTLALHSTQSYDRMFALVDEVAPPVAHLDDAAVVGPEPRLDRKSTRLNSSHSGESRMPSSA